MNRHAVSIDKNHNIVPKAFVIHAGGLTKTNKYGVRRCFVRGYHCELHNMAKSGGEIVDWMIVIGWLVFFIEVKVPREVKDAKRQRWEDALYYYKELTPGEKSFFDESFSLKRICTTINEVWDFVEEMVSFIQAIEKDTDDVIFVGRGRDYIKSNSDA